MTSARYEPRPGTIPTLPVPDLASIARAHLIGAGGAGMSGIARLLLARGIAVTGSDLKESRTLQDLRAVGAEVHVGHRADRVGEPDVVVISSAVPEGNPELAEARRRGLPVLARAQVLAALASGKRTLAVSGTHGKTTTTSMLSVVLEKTGRDPTYVIGGDLNEIGSGARHGGSDVFVAEADESDGTFLLLSPRVGIVTNVEEDHLDFYADGTEIRAAFARFMERSERVIACADGEGVREALRLAAARPVTYGVRDGNDVRVAQEPDAGPSPGEGARGVVLLDGERIELSLAVPGEHNLLNACAAMLAAREVGVEPAAAAAALSTFSGVRRRFEHRGDARGARFFDDYAHHPTEIAATLAAARARDGTRLVAVFQPHRYSRTEALWRELGESLAPADLIVVTDVYGAGEEPIPGVSGKLLVDALAEAAPAKRVLYLPRRADVVEFLASEVRRGDVVLTLGAGDITMVAEETLDRVTAG